MIDYLTHPRLIDYNPFMLPSKQGGGGGMHIKTYFVKEALEAGYPNSRLIADSSEIEANIVLIEPLRFAMNTDGGERDYEHTDMLVSGLERSNAKKIVLSTELSLLRLEPSLRQKLLTVCDTVTASCKFQQELLKYVGIETSHIIRDPISDFYCSPMPWSARESQIVAVGNVAWYKNIGHLIKLYKALEGKVKRVYVGSHTLWRTVDQEPTAIRLQNELYEHCDVVVPECTMADFAKLLYNSRYGAWVSTHDTTSTGTISMLRAGLPVIAAAHGYAAELPVTTAQGLAAQVQACEEMLTANQEEMTMLSNNAADWCEKNVSYGAFIDQLNSVMRTV